LSLVGDRVSVSIVFVEWAPQRDSKVDEREVPWTCWKMREVADPQVRFENSRYKAEQPEKD
jgi:hypothetical protein